MAKTPITAFGRLEMHYTAYGKPHVARVFVLPFLTDAGVGTFSAPATPASLDALATALSGLMKPLYTTAAGLVFGLWQGLQNSGGGSEGAFPIVEGTITPGSGTISSDVNTPGAVSETTVNFRTGITKRAKFTMLGSTYYGSLPFVYSSLGAPFKALSDYFTGSAVIVSRGNTSMNALIDITFDTNDGLTRRYRR